MNIKQRQAIERKVVRKLVRVAKAHGFIPVRVYDGGDEPVPVRLEHEVLDAVFAVDDCRVYFRHPAEAKAHCAVIVLGNSGWDCIADASTGPAWDVVIAEVEAYAEVFEEVFG